MSNIKESLSSALEIDGTVGVAIGDWNTGFSLGQLSSDPSKFSESTLERAIALNAEVIKSKNKAREGLGITEEIEDILITLEKQYHLIRASATIPGVFFYMVMNRERANLALARIKLREVEKTLKV